jgi:hypothetical protein
VPEARTRGFSALFEAVAEPAGRKVVDIPSRFPAPSRPFVIAHLNRPLRRVRRQPLRAESGREPGALTFHPRGGHSWPHSEFEQQAGSVGTVAGVLCSSPAHAGARQASADAPTSDRHL